MSKRLLILTQYFPPELGAPQNRLFEFAVRLKRYGWDVDVLTALPNYPLGRVFEGYRHRVFVVEEMERLRVVRTWLYPSQSASMAKRGICYLTFACAAVVGGLRHCSKPDVILAETPPLTVAVAARVLARFWRVPYVLNVSDLWPESFVALGRLGEGTWLHRALVRLEVSCYRRARAVTGQSSEIVGHVQELVPGKPCEVISNGVDTHRFGGTADRDAIRSRYGWSDLHVFLYAGLHGFAQGLDQILEVAGLLSHRPDILFAFVGDGPVKPELMETAAKRNLINVRFHDHVGREEMACVVGAADVAFIPLASRIKGAVPSKIYEAMASRLPILLVAEGEPAERVVSNHAGITAPVGDFAAIAAEVERLADDAGLRESLGASGRRAAETLYSRDRIAERLNQFLDGVVQPRA